MSKELHERTNQWSAQDDPTKRVQLSLRRIRNWRACQRSL